VGGTFKGPAASWQDAREVKNRVSVVQEMFMNKEPEEPQEPNPLVPQHIPHKETIPGPDPYFEDPYYPDPYR
jgi:hypothetical protein